jgi:hypothetical protein
MVAVTYLTYRILPSMRKSGCGAILNVSSVVGFFPMPNFAVYAATKAYVTSFNEALRAELRNSNISVTAVCPGPVPTEFNDVASRLSQGYAAPLPELLTVSVQEVVRTALQAVSRDRARIIPGTLVNLLTTTLIFIPMFLKRLILNLQAGRDQASSSPTTARGYEISGIV